MNCETVYEPFPIEAYSLLLDAAMRQRLEAGYARLQTSRTGSGGLWSVVETYDGEIKLMFQKRFGYPDQSAEVSWTFPHGLEGCELGIARQIV